MKKKILVTGGCGFLGSHVCEFYISKGWDVVSYDNLTKHELDRTGFAADEARLHNWKFLEGLGVKHVKADVKDFEDLLSAAEGCNYIVHTAAQPAMTISWENPILDFNSNTLGTFNALEVARQLNIPVASCASVHCYGNEINSELVEEADRYVRNPVAINESYPTLGGTLTPLHASKAAGDNYTQVYIDTFKVEAASFRLSGIYGTRQFGGEDHGWVANFTIRSVLGWESSIFGTGKQVRDIVYATDVCRAFDAFYETRASGIYNIGGGPRTMISLLDCFDILRELGEDPIVKHGPDRHGDLRYFVCDISKAEKNMGWEPEIMPKEGIEMLLNWVKSNKSIMDTH